LAATDVSGVEATSRKNQANGYAGLDSSGKITTSLLPSSVTGGLSYQGVWDASTNTPTLQDGVGESGQYYQVNIAGSTLLGGNSTWNVGDQVAYDGTEWNHIVGNQAAVSSVAGRTGAVTLTSDDISGLGPLATTTSVGTGLALNGGVLSSAVVSVAGHTGAVTLASNDIGDFATAVNGLSHVGLLSANAITANGTALTLPSNTVILTALFTETANAAVSISVGTTSGGSDVMSTASVPASGTLTARSTSFSLLSFSTSKQLFVSSTNWNGASVNAKLWYLT
jgi:hypothetical protein